MGAPIIRPVRRLVRALLVKYLYNLALRPTEELIGNHLLIKWFVGYSLFEALPDHSYLNRFELWVFRHCPRLFFDVVIRLIDQLCPEDRARNQLADTFGMQARAAKTCLIDLLRPMIRETQVDTGTQPDNVAWPQVLQSRADHHNNQLGVGVGSLREEPLSPTQNWSMVYLFS